MDSMSGSKEAIRLEELWSGEFGDTYTDRNIESGRQRHKFWRDILEKYPIERVLEVGCNVGGNLRWIGEGVSHHEIYGVDISSSALEKLRGQLPGVNAVWAPARELPFREGWFDLVFTAGVLIHQPDATLPIVMSEIVRCSKRFVLCMEYFAENTTEIPYRSQERALFKRNYGWLYQEMFPQLKLLEQGFLSRDQGWDEVTYWMFQKER